MPDPTQPASAMAATSSQTQRPRVAVFSTRSYDRTSLTDADPGQQIDWVFFDQRLDATTVGAAEGALAVCVFVNDQVDAAVVRQLAAMGVRLVLLRCAGFNNVDLVAAAEAGVAVARVPEYSPHAVAEHTLALLLALNRKLHRAYNRVREGNFALDGLLGFDLHGKTIGVVGTGRIGATFCRILTGFGVHLLATDPAPSEAVRAMGVQYVELNELLERSDVVSLHCPLTPATRHLIDEAALARMKPGAMLLNTSRGAVVDAKALIRVLKSGQLGALGLDVYEEEAHLFFRDLSGQVLQDDVFARLLTFPNVLITGHQGFFTREALAAIAATTVDNLHQFLATGHPRHPVSVERIA